MNNCQLVRVLGTIEGLLKTSCVTSPRHVYTHFTRDVCIESLICSTPLLLDTFSMRLLVTIIKFIKHTQHYTTQHVSSCFIMSRDDASIEDITHTEIHVPGGASYLLTV